MDRVLDSTPVAADADGSASPSTFSRPDVSSHREFELKDTDFRRITRLIYAKAGIVLSEQKRDMVVRRLSKRIRHLNLRGFREYMDEVEKAESREIVEFCNALTTNLTAFFREPHHFDKLRSYFEEHGQGRTYRIWSAACSTGEEPYSIAMTAVEHFGQASPPLRLLCTDIDTDVVAKAASGVYDVERLASMTNERKTRFFQRGSGEYSGLVRVDPLLRSFMKFQRKNLLDQTYDITSGVDVVFLRNVMIYFDRATQRHVLERMHRVLAPDGLLIVGHSENLFHASDLFKSSGQTVYSPVAKE
ncbi:MAG: CheR family methyltransferase [Oceanococcaceae bacterium]